MEQAGEVGLIHIGVVQVFGQIPCHDRDAQHVIPVVAHVEAAGLLKAPEQFGHGLVQGDASDLCGADDRHTLFDAGDAPAATVISGIGGAQNFRGQGGVLRNDSADFRQTHIVPFRQFQDLQQCLRQAGQPGHGQLLMDILVPERLFHLII